MATMEQQMRNYAAQELDRPARQRFREVSETIIGPRQAAFTEVAQIPFQAQEGGAPTISSPGGVLRGSDLARRGFSQAQRGGQYARQMGDIVGTSMAEEAEALARFTGEQDAARRAYQRAQQETAQAALGLAGQTTSQVAGAVQRQAREVKDRRNLAFKLAYNDLLSQGDSVENAFSAAARISGYNPVTGQFTAPEGV